MKQNKKLYLLILVIVFTGVGVLTLQSLRAGPQDPNDPDFPLADTNGDLTVNIFDLSYTLNKWDTADPAADFNSDGRVSILDLSYLLAQWGRVDNPSSVGPAIVSPIPGATLAGATQTVTWESNGSDEYWISAGSTPEGGEYYHSFDLTASDTSVQVTGLPTDGSQVYITTRSRNFGGVWAVRVETYTAFTQTGGGPDGDAWDYYGHPFTPVYLGNIDLHNIRITHRFQAKTTGQMIGLQNYFQTNTSRSGYSGRNRRHYPYPVSN